MLEKLIRAGADVEAGDAGPGTALHFAALGGHCNSMTTLIEVGGASINAFSEEYGPVINAAILSGKVNAVRQVMRGEVRFDLDYTKCECESPLSLSAGRAEPSVFQEILVSEQEKWRQNAKLLDSALYSASYSGKLESVKILLGFDHIYTNTTLENATLAAAREKEWSCVDALLDYVIDGSAKGQRRNIGLDNVFYLAASGREDHLATLQKIWGYTGDKISQDICDVSMYHASIHKKNATVVWLLETCRADANARSEQSSRVTAAFDNEEGYAEFSNALNAAASTGNASLVKSLIKNGAAINDGYALQLAASEGHLDLVEALLEAGASPSRKVENSTELGFYSAIALQAACDKNRATVVQALLKHGADPNSGGETMSHPILAATQLSSADILNMLLEAAEIDVNVVGGDDQSTALINAASHMDTDCERSLLDKRARIDERNSSGETALIVASRKGNIDCVTLLCERGADVTYRSPRHGMPIAVAAEALHPACARILAEHMGKTIAEFRVLGE